MCIVVSFIRLWLKEYRIWLVIFARYLFLRFSRVKSHSWKLKPWKFCCPCVKRTNRVSIPGLVTSIQQPTKACPRVCLCRLSLKLSKMLRKHRRTIQTAAQGRERKQSPQVPDSPIMKIKTAKISEIGILAYYAKICTCENYQPYGNLQESQIIWYIRLDLSFV